MTEVTRGMTLLAHATSKTYRVTEVTATEVHVTGLPPVPRDELISDIKNGKIEVLSY